MSQDELAEKLNVTRQSISLWENNQTQPTLDNIIALSKLFNVSTDDMLSTDGIDRSTETDKKQIGEDNGKKRKSKGLIISLVLILAAVIVAVVLLFTLKSCSSDKTGTANIAASSLITADDRNTENNCGTDSGDPLSAEDNRPEAASQEPAHTTTSTPKEKTDIYKNLKSFVVNNGKLNGDYCSYTKSADNYGGYADEDYSLTYWGDTDTLEFCLHSVLDETYSINFYLRIPKTNNGTYEYISSYYYRKNGEYVYEAHGTIDGAEFTSSYPLNCSKYLGDTDMQNDFMEMSRVGVCDAVKCLKEFVKIEETGCTFEDFGFENF